MTHKPTNLKCMKRPSKAFWRELIIVAAAFNILYFTGWGSILLAHAQRLMLYSGLFDAQPSIEQKAPDTPLIRELSWVDAHGRPLEPGMWRDRVVIINIWATWCPPCRAELPGFQKLYEHYETREDVVLLMLSRDDNAVAAQNWAREQGYTWTVWSAVDRLPAPLRGAAIPRTYLLDREGRLRWRHEGLGRYDQDGFTQIVDRLAGEPLTVEALSKKVAFICGNKELRGLCHAKDLFPMPR